MGTITETSAPQEMGSKAISPARMGEGRSQRDPHFFWTFQVSLDECDSGCVAGGAHAAHTQRARSKSHGFSEGRFFVVLLQDFHGLRGFPRFRFAERYRQSPGRHALGGSLAISGGFHHCESRLFRNSQGSAAVPGQPFVEKYVVHASCNSTSARNRGPGVDAQGTQGKFEVLQTKVTLSWTALGSRTG